MKRDLNTNMTDFMDILIVDDDRSIQLTASRSMEADGGNLFLDETGELPMEIQPKLLHFLQEQEYERVGENKVRQAKVRVIAATNRDLKAGMKSWHRSGMC